MLSSASLGRHHASASTWARALEPLFLAGRSSRRRPQRRSSRQRSSGTRGRRRRGAGEAFCYDVAARRLAAVLVVGLRPGISSENYISSSGALVQR